MEISIKRLPSGWYHIQAGMMLWAQPRNWPCDEATLRAATFQGETDWADEFIKEVMKLGSSLAESQGE